MTRNLRSLRNELKNLGEKILKGSIKSKRRMMPNQIFA
ncbi:hypothetical protein LEP1GSC166_2217 [Leptospira kirschneri]|nr:hypothetical protein LEP1GSC166_2217 [Leptospira kirschneri]